MSAAAGGAAAAAAEAARRRREEEEALTGYTQADLADDWEFKILRSATRVFKDPARLRQALDEEARAGWVLVEKFDDQRLRLKRPAAAKAGDSRLDFDPYRTTFGMSDRKVAAIMVCIVFSIMGAIVLIALLAIHMNQPAPAHP